MMPSSLLVSNNISNMRIFDDLVDSYRNRNHTEFEELCKSSLMMDLESFCTLQDLLDSVPDVDLAYDQMIQNHPEWGD